MNDSTDAIRFDELDRAFDRALAMCVDGQPQVSVLFSGGVDSALVTIGLRGLVPFRLVAIGTAGSKDIARARSAGEELGLAVELVLLGEEEIARALVEADAQVRALKEPMRSVQIALAIALSHAPDRTVLVGQGADELFGGYAHFRSARGEELSDRRRADWTRLNRSDWPLSRAVASRLGKELRSPYLDDAFAAVALGIPLEPVTGEGPTKPLLRRWARHRGLPEGIAGRPKLALQYGSGVARVLARDAPRDSRPGAGSAG